jgi:hypothetical protein
MKAAPPVVEAMRACDAQRAASYERVYFKPERQADLRAMEAWLPTVFTGREVLAIACGTGWWTAHGARVVMLDNRYVSPSSTPLSRQDEHGNTYQQRSLDDGSVHEWRARDHYWALRYEWTGPDAA